MVWRQESNFCREAVPAAAGRLQVLALPPQVVAEAVGHDQPLRSFAGRRVPAMGRRGKCAESVTAANLPTPLHERSADDGQALGRSAVIYSSFGGGMISTGLTKSRSDRSRKDMGTHECLFLSWHFGYFASSIFLLAVAKSATLFV